MTQERRDEDKWHLDKRVPIAIMLTLLLQGIAFAYGYGVLNEKVSQNTRATTAMIETIPRLIRLETLVETMVVTLQDIKEDFRSSYRNRIDKDTKK